MPVSVNGKRMKAFELLETLNAIGAEHGIGRIDLVENRFVGMKSRGCYETPGGTLIMFAIRELEALTLDKNTLHYKQQRALEYAEMVYNGLWFTPLREALDAFFEKVSETTTGEVTLRLYKGNIEPLSRKIAVLALLARHRQLHHGRELRPEGRARLHQPDRAAHQGARRWRRKPDETLGRTFRNRTVGGLRALLRLARFRPAADRRRYPRLAGLRPRAGAGRHPDRRRARARSSTPSSRSAPSRPPRRSSRAPPTRTSTRWSSAS